MLSFLLILAPADWQLLEPGTEARAAAMTDHLGQLIQAHPRLGARNALARGSLAEPVSYTVASQRKRNEMLRRLRKMLVGQPAGQRAEIIFRLAELFWQTGEFFYRQEYGAFEQRLIAWKHRGADPSKKPRLVTPKATTFMNQAMKNYRIILEKYPRYPRRDQVLYVMADHLYAAGKRSAGVRYYVELVKTFPQSSWAADAYLALGEHFLANRQGHRASKAFERAKKSTDGDRLLLAQWGLCRSQLEAIAIEGCLQPLIEEVEDLVRREASELPVADVMPSHESAPEESETTSKGEDSREASPPSQLSSDIAVERVDGPEASRPRAGGLAASCQFVATELWTGLLVLLLGRRRRAWGPSALRARSG